MKVRGLSLFLLASYTMSYADGASVVRDDGKCENCLMLIYRRRGSVRYSQSSLVLI